jgi:hypothetical protein
MRRGRDQGTGFTGRSIFKDYLCGGSNTTIKLRLNIYRGVSQTKHDLGHIIHGERQKQGKINEREKNIILIIIAMERLTCNTQ